MKVPMTQEGYQKLSNELKDLKTVQRPKIIESIAVAREFGDISENAEYHTAKEQQDMIENRIVEIEDRLASANVIDISKIDFDYVAFGATVQIVDEDTDEEYCYTLLGEVESNLEKGIISISSPIGMSLLGKSVGDSADVVTPSGKTRYFEVISIEYKALEL